MKISNESEKKYLRETKKLLIGDSKKKNDTLKAYQNEIEEYLEEKPNATYDNIVEFFGSPSEAAAEAAAEVPIEYVKKRMGFKLWIVFGILCALLMWGIGVTAAVIDAHSSTGYFVETLAVEEEYENDNIQMLTDALSTEENL
ncbi:MAG: hypothetical protein J6B75_02570 [Ruminococcus sp.]|nr:hypothetical protein [Ruminococcus sp.]